MIAIDKDIPLANKTRGSKYPFNAMEVGDSFFVADRSPKQMNGTIRLASKRLSKRFSVRFWSEGDLQGSRVWRIE